MADGTDATTAAVRRRALARADAGKSLSLDELTALLTADGETLETLLAIAARQRDLGWGETVTYSRKVFVPLTMLCRDHCHYCTFAKPPAKLDAPYLTPDEVVSIAAAGARAGCKEALFTLGDRPEERYPEARAWLDARGHASTLDYVRAVAIRVIEDTGLLPHLNPGVMSYEELARLKHVSASMGIMLETSSDRLSAKGGPHFGSPDKLPAVRLRTIEDAGRLAIPFTTGILVGIGETPRERAASLLAIRDLHLRYHHIQEVIVQNFRAKPGTAMHRAPEPTDTAFLAAVAVARLVLGPHVSVQAPPNLSDEAQRLRLLDAGINDWGGVSPLTPDHVNPERPWPQIEALAATTAARGKHLRERLAIYPRYAEQPDPWVAGKMRAPIAALLGPEGLAVEGQRPEPVAWQDPGLTYKPRSIALTFAKEDGAGLRADADPVYGTFAADNAVTAAWAAAAARPRPAGCRDPRRPSSRGSPPPAQRRPGAGAVPCRGGGARCALPRRRRSPVRCGRARGHLRHQSEHQLHQRLLRRLPFLRVRAAGGRRRVLHADPGGGRGPCGGGVDHRRDGGLRPGRDPSGPARHLLRRPDPGREGARPGHACARVQPDGDHERRGQTRRLARRIPRRASGCGPRHDARNGGRDPR